MDNEDKGRLFSRRMSDYIVSPRKQGWCKAYLKLSDQLNLDNINCWFGVTIGMMYARQMKCICTCEIQLEATCMSDVGGRVSGMEKSISRA